MQAFSSDNFFCFKYGWKNCEIIYILNKHVTYFAKFISGGMFDADHNNGQRPKAWNSLEWCWTYLYCGVRKSVVQILLNCLCCKPCISYVLTRGSGATTQGRPAAPLSPPPLSRLDTEHQFSMYVVLYALCCTTCEMWQLPTAVQIGTGDRGAGGWCHLCHQGGNPVWL